MRARVWLLLLALGAAGLAAHAQPRGGLRGGRAVTPWVGAPQVQTPCPQHPHLPALVATYAQLWALDADHDGRFNAAELLQLRRAVAASELQAQSTTPPDQLVEQLQRLYEWMFPFDLNRDGRLDANEAAALSVPLLQIAPQVAPDVCRR